MEFKVYYYFHILKIYFVSMVSSQISYGQNQSIYGLSY